LFTVQPLAADDSLADGKVVGSEGEGHDVEVKGEGQGRGDVQCELALSEQKLAAVKRHLAESRRENDDLLKAVAYLRHKLDTVAPTDKDTPTTADLHTNDNNRDVTVTSADAAAENDDDENYDDDELWGQRSPTELRNHNSK